METSSRIIPEKLFFRIGEVCALIKVQPHVLRYWETEFPMLTPQKNRAGQRVYRRKDVEMVFRIRDLLYEEKFTIAGAKRKLLDDARSGNTPKSKPAAQQLSMENALGVEPASAASAASPGAPKPPAVIQPPVTSHDDQSVSPHMKRMLRLIKHDLEDLLTTLNSDASIDDRSK
ncbi:MAG TPA: MerR family transcriptional regulator [Blastocatellia bacterium]|nr:MerR family transcriptional regulator [Blastocatellia bacterium]